MNPKIDDIGKKLIFLISQPRAGSTLTQRILGNHPEIHTVSEPWLMLHPLYALRKEGYDAEYNARWCHQALINFLKEIPEGEATYFQAIRKAYTSLYASALATSGKSYFLDKTPRYYHIIPELSLIFPQASFILLLRNPLSVLCSIYRTWIQDKWQRLYLYKHDLLQAPYLLLDGIKHLQNKACVLHYEKILESPEREFQKIYQQLGLNFDRETIDYDNTKEWEFGDRDMVYRYTQPNSQNLDRWIEYLKHPQVWCLANDYLQFLGKDILENMGYSWESLNRTLDLNRPSRIQYWKTLPLEFLLREPHERRKIEYESLFLKLSNIFK